MCIVNRHPIRRCRNQGAQGAAHPQNKINESAPPEVTYQGIVSARMSVDR